MLFKQREVETLMFYGASMDVAHAAFESSCKDKHVLDTKMGTLPDGRSYFCAIVEKRIDKRQTLVEG